jgi:hypothetical protein
MLETFKLNNGLLVLGKLYKDKIEPIRYTNRKQADLMAQKIDGKVIQPRMSVVFYVVPKQNGLQNANI